METKIFDVGIYHLIVSTVVLSPEEREFLSELYNDSLGNGDFLINDIDMARLKRLYNLTIEVLKENIKSLEKRLDLIEK